MASPDNEQQLRFRWNDHMQHISKVLTLQRLEEQFCDVTLVSDDGFVMKAHQAILASTSAYFQRVFSEITADQHPMVVLRGANFRELTCILDYMYQGSTQVHQNLMESVLEVADILEVKGLSQIRGNNSIKKFLPSTSPSSRSANSTPHSQTGDASIGHSRTPDEQIGSFKLPDEHRDPQPPPSSEIDNNVWSRFSASCVNETRISAEETGTQIDEPPPPSHMQVSAKKLPSNQMQPSQARLPVPSNQENQEEVQTFGIQSSHARLSVSSNRESQDEVQTSGIDLTMAKNEPWSPKDSSTPQEHKEYPSRKRRKLMDGFSTEETVEPEFDPDWGRIGAKPDDRITVHPRTISFTSMSSETESRSKAPTPSDVSEDFQREVQSPSNNQAFINDLPAASLTSQPNQLNLQIASCESLRQASISSTKVPASYLSIGPSRNIVPQQELTHDVKENVHLHEKMNKGGTLSERVTKTAANPVIVGFYEVNQEGNIIMQLPDSASGQSISNQTISRDPGESPVILSMAQSYINPQNVSGKSNIKLMKVNEGDPMNRAALGKRAEIVTQKSSSRNPTPPCQSSVKSEINHISLHSPGHTIKSVQGESHGYRRSPSVSDFERKVSISTSTVSVSSPMQLICASSGQPSSSSPSHILGEFVIEEPPENVMSSEDTVEDPLTISGLTNVGTSTTLDQSMLKRTIPLSSFVDVIYHHSNIVLRNTKPKSLCPLEEKLKRHKSAVKRPMNPFMLFQSEMKKKVSEDHPGESYQMTLKRLGIMWKTLPNDEKQIWLEKAEHLKEEHKRKHPDYQYNPYEAQKKRREYLRARSERSNLYRVT